MGAVGLSLAQGVGVRAVGRRTLTEEKGGVQCEVSESKCGRRGSGDNSSVNLGTIVLYTRIEH